MTTATVQDVDHVHRDADSTSSNQNDDGGSSLNNDCNKLIVIDHDEKTEVGAEVMAAASADPACGIVSVVNKEVKKKPMLSSSSDHHHNDTMINETSVERKLQTTAPSWVERGGSKLVGTSDFDKFGTPSCLSSDGMVPYWQSEHPTRMAGLVKTLEAFKYMSTSMAAHTNHVVLPFMVLLPEIPLDGPSPSPTMERSWQSELRSVMEWDM